MGTDKRARQKEGHRARKAAEQAALRRARYRRIGIRAAVIALIVVGILLIINVFSDDDGDSDAASPETTAATTPPTTADEPLDCPAEDGSSPQTLEFPAPQPMCIDPDATYTAVMDTSAGEITIDLDPALDPESVNNFVTLARWHYYDDSTFHRIIDGFMIQGGDPVGDPPGTGGPGYQFTGAQPEQDYELGSFAVANRGDPSTNGAQFFIVTGQQGIDLPPLYSLMGKVSSGLEIVTELQTVETDEDDRPLEDVAINSVSITENPPDPE